MNKDAAYFKESGISYDEIISVASERYVGIYVMDVKNDKVVIIKSFYTTASFNDPKEVAWDENIVEETAKGISPQFKALAQVSFSRPYIQRKFNNLSAKDSIILQRTNGSWCCVNFQPLRIENNECSVCLVTFVDVTEVKKKYSAIERQIEDVHKNYKDINWFFCQVAKDLYREIIKFDLFSGETYRIQFENNEAKEVPINNWDVFFDKIFDNVHPIDKKEAMEIFSKKNLKSLNPGDRIEHTCRILINDEYRWYSISIVMSDIELSIATAFTVDVTDGIFQKSGLLSSKDHDDFTRLFNINKYAWLKENEYKFMNTCGVMYVDIDDLMNLNARFGHEFGNEAIKTVAEALRSVQNRDNLAFRCGDDEFMLISKDQDEHEFDLRVRLFRRRLYDLCEAYNVQFDISIGVVWTTVDKPLTEIVSVAYRNMKANKIEVLEEWKGSE